MAFIRRLPKLPGKLRSGDSIIASALRTLATQDPAATVAWLQAEKGTPLVRETARLAVVGGIAQEDPVEAFKAISALQVTDFSEAGDAIVSSGEVSERGGRILEGLRGYLNSHDGEDAKMGWSKCDAIDSLIWIPRSRHLDIMMHDCDVLVHENDNPGCLSCGAAFGRRGANGSPWIGDFHDIPA